jgi:excisionase family DNA binding protein
MSVFLESAPADLANQKIFLTRDEARRILGVSFGCLDAVIRSGELRVVRVGKRVLIPYRELQRFVDTECDRG